MTNRKLVVSVGVIVLVVLVGFVVWQNRVEVLDDGSGVLNDDNDEIVQSNVGASDYKNATYVIDGVPVMLVDGYAETEVVPGTASLMVTRYFGNELFTDLDGDGDEDVAFIITKSAGGSGTFFYAVAALQTETGYVGSDGVLLGDRIAPQATNLSPNPRHVRVVTFNYAEHGPDQGMADQPSIGKSTYLKMVPETNTWGIVEPDFEGESAN